MIELQNKVGCFWAEKVVYANCALLANTEDHTEY